MSEDVGILTTCLCIGLFLSFNVGLALWFHMRAAKPTPEELAGYRPKPEKFTGPDYHYDAVSVMPNPPSDPPDTSGSDPPPPPD